MASNKIIIEKLREVFNPVSEESKDYNINAPFTNCALLFAYNGTGKTRLSYDFAHFGRKENDPQHTLYYNAYTEDLFTWDNDLENNTEHRLLINQSSSLIQGLAGYNFSDKLRSYLHVFTDIDFDLSVGIHPHGTDGERLRVSLLAVIHKGQHVFLVKLVVGAVQEATRLPDTVPDRLMDRISRLPVGFRQRCQFISYHRIAD